MNLRKPKKLRKITRVRNILDKQMMKCPLCGLSLEKELNELCNWYTETMNQSPASKKRCKININYDHIIPRSKGGKDNRSNKQLTHADCNFRKGNKV